MPPAAMIPAIAQPHDARPLDDLDAFRLLQVIEQFADQAAPVVHVWQAG